MYDLAYSFSNSYTACPDLYTCIQQFPWDFFEVIVSIQGIDYKENWQMFPHGPFLGTFSEPGLPPTDMLGGALRILGAFPVDYRVYRDLSKTSWKILGCFNPPTTGLIRICKNIILNHLFLLVHSIVFSWRWYPHFQFHSLLILVGFFYLNYYCWCWKSKL